MPFHFQRLEIPEVILIRPQRFRDHRGLFLETYSASEFAANGIPEKFVQDNLSRSSRGVLRGLHYQKIPKAQGKLVLALKGTIFDVAVDIRRGSPTYGKWTGAFLSSRNLCMLYIPPGFAHGFCVLSAQADVVYKVTEEYAPDLERGIIWNDPSISVRWPIAGPLLSGRDDQLPYLSEADNNFGIV